jgi:peptidoglycan/LPS O-acetylase OafA/YrhL
LRTNRFILAVMFTIVVAASVIREDHRLNRVLSSRALAQVGAVSYGMYLMHGLVYNCLDRIAGGGTVHDGLVNFMAALLLTFVVAKLSYRYYESYFLALKSRFEPSPR